MKKLLSIVAIAAIMASCNDSKKDETPAATVDSPAADASAVSNAADSASKMVTNAADSANKMVTNVADSASKMMDKAKDSANKVMDKAKEAVKH